MANLILNLNIRLAHEESLKLNLKITLLSVISFSFTRILLLFRYPQRYYRATCQSYKSVCFRMLVDYTFRKGGYVVCLHRGSRKVRDRNQRVRV